MKGRDPAVVMSISCSVGSPNAQPRVAYIPTQVQPSVAHRDIVAAVLPDAIAREIDIDAPPDTVWAIVTEARHLAGWFSDEAEIDLRPGGAMLLTWHGHGAYRASVETVEPPVTFAFRWVRRDGQDP